MIKENTLATVRCPENQQQLLALLDSCGLRGKLAGDSDVINIVSGGRLDEPDIDQDLMRLAFTKMEIARVNGHLPQWSLI